MKKALLIFGLFTMVQIAPASGQENIDTSVLAKIRDQAFNHSQVMNIAFHLTDASGPRLSNSPGLVRAQQWVIKTLTEWGVTNVNLEPWGTFGRGWEVKKSYLALKEPYYQAMMAYPEAWTRGSGGPFTAGVAIYPKDSASQVALRGTFKGKLVLVPWRSPYNSIQSSFSPVASRYTDSDLDSIVSPPVNTPSVQPVVAPPVVKSTPVRRVHRPRMEDMERYCEEEGALGIIESIPNDKNGTVFVQGGGSRELKQPMNLMHLSLMFEDKQRLQRLIENGFSVSVEGDVACQEVLTDTVGYNVVGEIPGTDPTLKSQLVMLGGHLDSWQGATGATDNGAGSAVMLEVIRILKSIEVKPRRTIRIVLWSGEEQGLLGSKAYVKRHFGDPDTKKWTAEQGKVSAYYNLDNGTGKIRGIYLQQDSAAGPIFKQWLANFSDLDASTVTFDNTGGTDHESFTAVGIPGFQFIQDPIEYYTRTHHSNMDSYDHLLPDDLEQAACIIAAFVYQTAMRDALIPRKS